LRHKIIELPFVGAGIGITQEIDFDVQEETEASSTTAEQAAEVEDTPVVRFIQKMLIDAINQRASDLHFEPYEQTYRVRFRVDVAFCAIFTRRSRSGENRDLLI
jgi:type II secretory ATPase GspE/PulE/Tfp pilus assembly ATPase PilB-like protein